MANRPLITNRVREHILRRHRLYLKYSPKATARALGVRPEVIWRHIRGDAITLEEWQMLRASKERTNRELSAARIKKHKQRIAATSGVGLSHRYYASKGR